MYKLIVALLITISTSSEAGEKVCTTLRGNGFHIPAHFGALARISEQMGTVEAISTSSSGAMSAFLYESIMMNPLIRDADSSRCNSVQCRERVSFLLKSFPVFLEALYHSKTIGSDLKKFLSQINTLKALFSEKKTEKESEKSDNSSAAFVAIALLHSHHYLKDFVTESFYQKIGLDPVKGRLDFWNMNTKEAKFLLTFLFDYRFPDFRVFSRDGLINFDQVIEVGGVASDYYAARNSKLREDMSYILKRCARGSFGKTANEILSKRVDGQSCELLLRSTMVEHIDSTPLGTAKRLDDRVASHLEMFLTTSMISGEKVVDEFLSHRGKKDSEPYFININEKNLKVGVYGAKESLKKSVDPTFGSTDYLHKKTIILPNRTWRHALRRVLAEPGAAPAKVEKRINGTKYVTLGGWIDHNASIYLKNNHCDQIVWVTKKYSAYSLVKPLVDLLLKPDSEFLRKVYDPRNKNGVTANRRNLTDAVVCTDWDRYTELDYQELIGEGYNAPIITNNRSVFESLKIKNKQLGAVSTCFAGETLPGKKSYSQK